MKVVLLSIYPDIKSFGLRTLSACLKKEGHDVRLVFLPMSFTERYEKSILKEVVDISEGAGLIGISLMTNFYDNAIQVTNFIKDRLDVHVIWGGIHPTIRPKECLNFADMVCLGEGEGALLELVKKIEQGGSYLDIENLWFRNKGKIIKNRIRPLIHDLSDIPNPDYDYVTHYTLNNGRIQRMTESLMEKQLGNILGNNIYGTMPTRGCPYSCTYCCNNTLNKMYSKQKSVRKKGTDSIIQELLDAKNRMPFIDWITFDDDAFLMCSVREIAEFSKKYKEKIGMPLYVSGVTPSTLSKEKLSMLVDAGLIQVRMGIQSGSESSKNLYNRSQSNQQVLKAVKIINEFKDRILPPKYDVILDNPWESEHDLIETLLFFTSFPIPYRLNFYSLNFYPGTDLYRKAREEGVIVDDMEDVYRKHYKRCKQNYINSLFFMLNKYASSDQRVSLRTMTMLTSPVVKWLKMRWLLYGVCTLPLIMNRLSYLFHKIIEDIRTGNWSRIFGYINRKFLFKLQRPL